MRRFLSGLLYLVVGLPVVLSGLLALSIRPWAMDKGFYSRAIDDPRLWASLRSPLVLKGAPEKVEIGGYVFSGPALYGALQKHLPEVELRSFAERSIDEVFNSIDSGKSSVFLDLRPIKASFTKNSAAIAEDYLAALPPGSPGGTSTDISVRPGGMTDPLLVERGGKAFEGLAAAIPDEVKPDLSVADLGRAKGSTISARSFFDRLSSTGLAAGAALLLGLGFLGGGGLGRSFARSGRYLMIPSALVLLTGLVLSIPGAPIAVNLLTGAQASADLGFLKALGGWLGSWLGVASRSFFVVGLAGMSIGALLSSVRRILEPREY
jgi:hypothetical protein